MKQIRQGVFETNSSSTHSLTMCMKSEFDAWKRGELYLNQGWWSGDDVNEELKKKDFITKDEAIELIMSDKYLRNEHSIDELRGMDKSDFDEILQGSEVYTYKNYNYSNLEWFDDSFTTPNGEEIVAFGEFGYDG